MYFLLEMGIFHCCVSLPEGTYQKKIGTVPPTPKKKNSKHSGVGPHSSLGLRCSHFSFISLSALCPCLDFASYPQQPPYLKRERFQEGTGPSYIYIYIYVYIYISVCVCQLPTHTTTTIGASRTINLNTWLMTGSVRAIPRILSGR